MAVEHDNAAVVGTRTTAPRAPRRRRGWPVAIAMALARRRSDAERRAAISDCWRALWMSRAFVWITGVCAVLVLGRAPTTALDPPGLTRGLGSLGDRLAAPAASWDAAWLLTIARHGYGVAGSATASARAAFFPLYPMLVAAVGTLGVPLVLGGALVSLAAFGGALYGLHRLTTLELPGCPMAARWAVFLAALFPTALFFSADYSESLFLALSVGVFWCARQGRWALVGALGAMAAATRNTGVLLLIPAAIIYLYGPRADRFPDAAGRRWLPRYRLRTGALWLGLVPGGLLAYGAYWLSRGGSVLAPLTAQGSWHRHFVLLGGLWQGALAGVDGVRQLLVPTHHAYFATWHGNSLIAAQHSVVDLLTLLALAVAVVGALRVLPAAYGLYALSVLAVGLSDPVTYEPLMSLPRFAAVLFPIYMWGGVSLAPRARLRRVVLVASTTLLGVFAVQFATWHWVA